MRHLIHRPGGPGSWRPRLRDDAPAYLAIVQALKRDVAAGRLSAGERLPTHRQLARDLDVGLGTVTHAYREAERRGLVQARVGRGTFVASAVAAGDSLGLPESGGGVVEMSVDLPVHAEDPDLAPVLRDLARRGDLDEMLRYHAHAGTPRHRRAGVEWLRRFDLDVGERNVAVCAGTQHALTVSLMTIVEPDAVVLSDRLTYPGIKAAARHLRMRLLGVASDEHGIMPDAVEAVCRQRRVGALYVTPSLHNPTTTQLPIERREAIAALAERHDFIILEDDVHRLFSDAPPPPIARLAPTRTHYIASISKAVTGGLRVAFASVPDDRVESVSQAIWATMWMAPTLAVEIVARWIDDGTADAVVARKRVEAGARQALCRERLAGARYDAQSHGYFLWLHLPAPWTSAEFALEARQLGVAVTPSTAFLAGGGSPPPAVRVCVAAPETRDAMLSGIQTLRRLLDTGPGEASPIPRS